MALAAEFVLANAALHDLKGFDCGKVSLNDYLGRFAVRNSSLGLSRTWVLTEQIKHGKQPIAAYFTLGSSTVVRNELPKQITTGLSGASCIVSQTGRVSSFSGAATRG